MRSVGRIKPDRWVRGAAVSIPRGTRLNFRDDDGELGLPGLILEWRSLRFRVLSNQVVHRVSSRSVNLHHQAKGGRWCCSLRLRGISQLPVLRKSRSSRCRRCGRAIGVMLVCCWAELRVCWYQRLPAESF